MKKKGQFDYILLETTGLADPGPIANIFWVDEELGSDLKLDGIITVIDAKYIQSRLEEDSPANTVNLATRQIALADRLILNKQDMVDAVTLEQLEQRIRGINSVAPMVKSTKTSGFPLDFLLDINSFEDIEKSNDFLSLQNTFKIVDHIDKAVRTVLIRCNQQKISKPKLDKWIQTLLWENKVPNLTNAETNKEVHILRLKALIDMEDSDRQIVIQGVEETYDYHEGQVWEDGVERESRVVVIGKLGDITDDELRISSDHLKVPKLSSYILLPDAMKLLLVDKLPVCG
ncbi:COBW domain-containing protein 1 [Nowakowskiella sp. JEL0407]|nr:COBW domain-containing protein 1 [Nowakowskiella sp. JEL0407]